MSIVLALMIGFLAGFCFGGVGMFLLIKETATDRAIEVSEMAKIIEKSNEPMKPYCKIGTPELEDPCEVEDLIYPEEV